MSFFVAYAPTPLAAAADPGVSSMHPGFVDTPLIAAVKGTPIEQSILQNTPLGRLARPEEIDDVITFRCGPKASYMTGSEVYVDGVWTAAA